MEFREIVTVTLYQRRQWQPTPVLLPGKSHGQRSPVGCSSWGRQESDTTEQLHFHFSLSCIEEGNGNPLQYSCLENSLDRGAWWATVSGIAESDMTEHARTHTSVTLPQQLGIGLLGLTGCSLLAVFSNHEELSDDLAF